MINYCIQNDKVQWEYVKNFTNAPYIVKEGFGFKDGLFTGYDEDKRDYDRSTWNYEIGEDGFVKADDDAAEPALRLEPAEGARRVYTPEMVERICGTPKDKFLKVAR